MPLSAPEDCGANADGTLSVDFCRHCFQSGSFIADLTQAQMIDKLVGFAEQRGMTADQARQMAGEVLSKLKRWNGS